MQFLESRFHFLGAAAFFALAFFGHQASATTIRFDPPPNQPLPQRATPLQLQTQWLESATNGGKIQKLPGQAPGVFALELPGLPDKLYFGPVLSWHVGGTPLEISSPKGDTEFCWADAKTTTPSDRHLLLPKQDIPNLGVIKNCGPKVSGGSGTVRVWLRPNAKWRGALAAVSHLWHGLITPKEYFAITSSLLPADQARKLKGLALTGRPKEILIPLRIEGKSGQLTFPIAGHLRIIRIPRPSEHFEIFATTNELNARQARLKKECDTPGKAPIDSDYCAHLRGRLNDSGLSGLRYKWNKLSKEELQSLAHTKDHDGSTVLMKFLADNCYASRETVGASGFSSGKDELRPERQAAFTEIVKASPDLADTDAFGRSALHYAVFYGCSEEADFLAGKGLKPTADSRGTPFLSYALAGGLDKWIESGLSSLSKESFASEDSRLPEYQYGFQFYDGPPPHPQELRQLPFFRELSLCRLFPVTAKRAYFERFLKSAPLMPEACHSLMIESALVRASIGQLDLLRNAGISFWREQSGKKLHLGLNAIKSGRFQKQHESFIAHLKKVFEPDRKILVDQCLADIKPSLPIPGVDDATAQKHQQYQKDYALSNCLLALGECEPIPMMHVRAQCFAQAGQCSLSKEGEEREACEVTSLSIGRNPECNPEQGSEEEIAKCKLLRAGFVQDKSPLADSVRKIWSKPDGVKWLSRRWGHLSRFVSFPDSEKALEECLGGDFSPRMMDQPESQGGPKLMAYQCFTIVAPRVLEFGDKETERLNDCASTGSWKACAYPTFRALATVYGAPAKNREAVAKHLKEALLRLCHSGEGSACFLAVSAFSTLDKVPTPESKKVIQDLALRACRQVPDASAFVCLRGAHAAGPEEALKIRLRFIESAGNDDVSSLANAYAEKKVSPKDAEAMMPKIAEACNKHYHGCVLEYLAAKDLAAAEAKRHSLEQLHAHIKTACSPAHHFCQGLKLAAERVPEAASQLRELCGDGIPAACATLKHFAPAVELSFDESRIRAGCDKLDPVGLRISCYHTYVMILSSLPKYQPLFQKLCDEFNGHPDCRMQRINEYFVMKAGKGLEEKTRKDCEVKKEVHACAVLATGYEAESQEKAFSYLFQLCKLSQSHGPFQYGCIGAFSFLIKTRQHARLAKLFKENCPSWGERACRQAEILVMKAGGPDTPLKNLTAGCTMGMQRDCNLLRDYYRISGKEKELEELTQQTCSRYKSEACSTHWKLQETPLFH